MGELRFSRFQRLLKLLDRVKQAEEKDGLIAGAWIGFQMGAGEDTNFGEYLIHLGLSDEPPSQRADVKDKSKQDDTEQLRRMGIEVKKVKK